MQLDASGRSCAPRRHRSKCQLEERARHMAAAAQLVPQPCRPTARSALACHGRGFLSLCASSRRVPPRGHACGPRSCPEPGSFDRAVFFASGWLARVSWLAPWRRSSKIRHWRCGLLASTGRSTSIRSLSCRRSTRASTSSHGRIRPTVAASIPMLHGLMGSSPLVGVRACGERCRACLP